MPDQGQGGSGGGEQDHDWKDASRFLKLLGIDMLLFIACVGAAIGIHYVVRLFEHWMPEELVLHALFKIAEHLLAAYSVFFLAGSIMRRIGAYFGYPDDRVRRWIYVLAILTVVILGIYAVSVMAVHNFLSLTLNH